MIMDNLNVLMLQIIEVGLHIHPIIIKYGDTYMTFILEDLMSYHLYILFTMDVISEYYGFLFKFKTKHCGETSIFIKDKGPLII